MIPDLSLQTVSGALDITDSDSDNYYFDSCNGELVLLSKIITPIGTNTCE